MAETTITMTLVATPCADCGCTFGLTKDMDRTLRRTGKGFYCPRGHCLTFGEGTVGRLQRRLSVSETQLISERDQHEAERRSHSATKGQMTKLRKRVHAGCCPYCNRHFANLQRHIASKHAPREKPDG